MTPSEHYRAAEAALSRATELLDLGAIDDAHALAVIGVGHGQLAAIAVPAGGRL